MVCERSEMFALGCALVRAFPQYSRQSSVKSKPDLKLLASFIIVDAEGGPSSALTDEEVNCLTYCGEGLLKQIILYTILVVLKYTVFISSCSPKALLFLKLT